MGASVTEPIEDYGKVEVVMAPGWVKLGGIAIGDIKQGDAIFLEPSTGNVSNYLPNNLDELKKAMRVI